MNLIVGLEVTGMQDYESHQHGKRFYVFQCNGISIFFLLFLPRVYSRLFSNKKILGRNCSPETFPDRRNAHYLSRQVHISRSMHQASSFICFNQNYKELHEQLNCNFTRTIL